MGDKAWDIDLVVKILRRQKELMLSSETSRAYESRLDFTQPDVICELKEIWRVIDHQVLDEFGVEVPPKFPGILMYVHKFYPNNQQIFKELDYVLRHGPYKDVLQMGSTYPDVELECVKSQEKHSLSRLHLHKERPLLIITSSAS
ncbi:uncharacterized protein LOC117112632 isoform X1 [Anneissia japonica]|uniref:uncharacterized protein LOC117112632 isoform X1 n=1 Tax=Anneissia japonica TaxID=1529436 RepID=UPI00142559D4|nr:uncharacterized protein LOC117112632 isoform X1 [Anneissia japonica]XP_033111635.1 uncharacterized protein LOC117112632 isoform X1 [Anneissia japonica]